MHDRVDIYSPEQRERVSEKNGFFRCNYYEEVWLAEAYISSCMASNLLQKLDKQNNVLAGVTILLKTPLCFSSIKKGPKGNIRQIHFIAQNCIVIKCPYFS